MFKSVTFAGVFAIIAIVGIVLFVDSSINGKYVSFTEPYARDYLVRPSGMEMHDDNGLITLRSDAPINQVCKNAPSCNGKAEYTCCKDDGTECLLPSYDDQAQGSCPSLRRSKCQCREEYLAGLAETYGPVPGDIAASKDSYVPVPLPADPYGMQDANWRWSGGAGYGY